jgi:general secretion pathway protein N
MIRQAAAITIAGAFAAASQLSVGFARDGRPLVATAYDPTRADGQSNRAIGSVTTATGADNGEESANPLWAVPLSVLVETRERPLFSASRRPPPVSAPTAVAAPQVETPVPIAQSDQERPPWTLVGTIVSPAASLAVLQNPGTQAISRVRVGEEDSGWRVRSVAVRSIIVEKGPQTVTLELPRASDAENRPSR